MQEEEFSHVDGFKIYVEQLKGGYVEKIREVFSPDFLDIHEKELAFLDPIFVEGEAYLAEGSLVLRLQILTEATLPCKICNEPLKVPLRLNDFYQTEPLENIKSGVFSMKTLLREAILLDVPTFAECNQGKCPSRTELEKFLKKSPSAEKSDTTGYRPFEGLNLDKPDLDKPG